MTESALHKALDVWKPGQLRCPDGQPHQMISDVAKAGDICVRCRMVQTWLGVTRVGHE